MNQTEVIVQVRVIVTGGGDPRRVAHEMVEDAIASRPQKWWSQTFVSQTDIEVVDA